MIEQLGNGLLLGIIIAVASVALSLLYGVTRIVNFGHAGNGNIHVNLIFDTIEEKNSENTKNCLEEIFDSVLDLNGTISGEHGIGIIKKNFLEKELDKITLDLRFYFGCKFIFRASNQYCIST